ncbi:MAG: PQQ-dependent sugar dehydrogenase [Burkholderiales bacterium]|nr:PQQ-dependent sugar dehydrogenase [Burkholderiales bacterium]
MPWQAGNATPADTVVSELVRSTLVRGLESPWGMEFTPDGRLLVTERAGKLWVIDKYGHQPPRAVRGLPKVDHRDHGGLLDVTIDSEFATNRLIYFSYTEAGRGFRARFNGLTVARARLSDDANRIEQFEILFRQKPRIASSENLGGRLAVSPDGYLFITIGDRRVPEERVRAQDLAFYHGKTVRIRTDGSVPADNPFVGRKGARPEIWSLGHRNPQGAFVHPDTGVLWIAEHGPYGGDEINIVHGGRNYGWPIVTYGCEYDTCAPIGEGTSKPGMEEPFAYWGRPAIAPSNLILYMGDQMPEWRGNLLVGTLAGRAVWRLELSGEGDALRVVRREALFADLGERIRDLRQGPDGALYLLTDGERARVIRVSRQNLSPPGTPLDL